MENFLEKIRNKPDRVKKMILWGSSSAITLVIFMFWLVALRTEEPAIEQSAVVVQSPWAEIKQSSLRMYENISEQVGKMKEGFGNLDKK